MTVKLPLDPRTLLQTPTSSNQTEGMGQGKYFYFGIQKTIQNICGKLCIKLNHNDFLDIAVNIDEVPLFKSSNESFWPILCMIKSIDMLKSEVFCVALYEGVGKPDCTKFLKLFVKEASDLATNGIVIDPISCTFKSSMLICDEPAKSNILKN
uniref:Uncharacterized protein LOC114347567 n=1 Tax=Diabrotica virgifera virgifera TaxID=50390 RepID=A0A6P7GX53_DIAVI